MNPGELRTLVTIQRGLPLADSYGDGVITWQSVAEVWAKIVPQAGAETTSADAVVGKTAMEVTIRYRRDVRPRDRLIYGDTVLDISGVADIDNRHEYLLLSCQSYAP